MTAPRGTPVLETERLRLRPAMFEDADALHAAFADPASMHWWTEPAHATLDQTRESLARHAQGWRRWIVTTRESNRAIGLVAAGEKRQGNVTEIGYMFVPGARGRGLAGEAVAGVLGQLFRAEGQRKAVADTDPENTASRRMLERLGFTLEGMLRAEWETHIGVRDTALYGLLASEWRD